MSPGNAMKRGALLAPLSALVLAPAVTASTTSVPRRLIDGSVPSRVPAQLRGQDSTFVMTRVRVVMPSQIPRLMKSCTLDSLPKGDRVVERIGVNGRSITFLGRFSTIEGCDRNPKANGTIWCGKAGWTWRGGRVSDPRLAVCESRRGRPVVAFGWINALPRARWIVVDQPGFREVYPVAAHLPVRVSTVSEIRSSTTFRTSQYDAQGVLLERKVVTAAVAS